MKFIYFIFFTALCSLSFPIFAFNQVNEVDSIDNLMNGNAIFDMDYHYPILKKYTYKSDSSITLLIQKNIIKAQKSNNQQKEFKGLFILGQLNLHKHNYRNAENYFYKALKKSRNKEEKLITTRKLSETKIENEQYLEALEYIRQIKQQINNDENPELLVHTLFREGFCYIQLRNYEIAEERFNQAYAFIEKDVIKELYGVYFMYKGLLHYKQFDYLNALANFYKGLEFFSQDTIMSNYVIILDYIGKIYFYQENYNKALTSFNDAQILYDKLLDIKGVGMTHYERAISNIELSYFDDARYHLKKAEEYFRLFNYEKGVAAVNVKFANLYNIDNKPDSALLYLHKVSPKVLIDDIGVSEYEYYKQYANYYLIKDRTDSAVYYSIKAERYCADESNIYRQIDCKILLSHVMSAAGNYSAAYDNQRIATSLKGELYKFVNSYEINILQSELESSRKQVVINTLTDEREIQDETIKQNVVELKKQKGYIYIGIIFLILLIVIIFLISFYLLQKRKDNKKLLRKNVKIAQQKEEIETQSQHLLEVNEELEKLSLVARETDNGIKIMNGVGYVVWVNEGYVKMHGYTLEDLQIIEKIDMLGQNASIDIQQLENVWYGDKQPITFESLNKTKTGEDIWVQTALTPILDGLGKIYRMIAIDSDITRIKNVEKELIEKNTDITSSISYAKRIQEAMMTPFSILSEYYKCFNFYEPKSIVSGDFYWLSHRHDRIIVVCADSTGHGVPGAFMSMIGMSFLNKIVNEKGFVSPDIILNRMRMNIINHLHQNGNDIIANDGIDMAIISIDTKNNQLEYAGAMNSVYVIRDGNIIELKADRMPVGYFNNEDRPFSSITISLEKSDSIYMFTDGYYDQFGGNSGSKMKGNRFKSILKRVSKEPMENQRQIIEDEFNKWKGSFQQVDDILLMGIKID